MITSSSTLSEDGIGGSFRAAILAQSRQPLVVDLVEPTSTLRAGQVLVRIRYSGICGAQINEINATKGPDKFLPHLLGHEGVGEVVEVGELVKTVAVGDVVVMHWMPGSGVHSDPARYLWHGKQLNAGWVTTMSEMSIVSENRVTRIESTLDQRYAPLLGCAATTAAGVIGRDAALRLGQSVVVLGTGGVGLLVVEAARASGAHPIVGVDIVGDRLMSATVMGATSVIDAREVGKSLEHAVIAALGGPPDVVIETSGSTSMVELGYRLVSGGGRCVLVGVSPHDQFASIDTLPLHFDTVLTGSKGGGTQPEVDIPKLAKLAEVGLFRLTKLPITVLSLDEVNLGIDMVAQGLPGRVVIDMSL